MCIVFASCKKTDSNVGKDILPNEDIIGATYTDTTSVICYTVPDDSMRTDESYVGGIASLIGSIADPVFGRTDASVYVNFSNPNNITNIGFGSDPKLDSVVLMVAYQKDSYYGDKSDPLQVNVYRLESGIYYDSSYYAYTQKTIDPQDLTYSGAGKTTVFDPSTSVYDGDTKYAPHLRIRLKNEVGQQFMDDTTKLASTSALQQFFKGVLITTKNTVIAGNDYGSIGYFDFTSPLSKISIYYHNGTNLTIKRIDLTCTSASARFNQYQHDYTNAAPEYKQQLDETNIALGNNNVFLQGMASSKVKIKFPNLKHFSDSGKIAINKAELVFQIDKSSTYFDGTKFALPARFALEGLTAANTTFTLPVDQSYDLVGVWGLLDGSSEYRFPISYTAQKIANGDYADFTFSMRIFQHHSNPARIVLGGKNNATYPVKLKVWYTRIK